MFSIVSKFYQFNTFILFIRKCVTEVYFWRGRSRKKCLYIDKTMKIKINYLNFLLYYPYN